MLLGRLSQSLLTINSLFTSNSASLHTSAALSSWGGGKLKTHTGTAKRFKQVGKRRAYIPSLTSDGLTLQFEKVLGPMYKRGRTGKQHLNGKMSHSQTARLRGTKVHESGHTIRTLNRLIGSHF